MIRGYYPLYWVTSEMSFLNIAVQDNSAERFVKAANVVASINQLFGSSLPALNTTDNYIDLYDDTHYLEKMDVYYFHPDHLGSSSYITNMAGMVSQHMEYLPFGELLVDEHKNSYNSPFKYNGKEFDEETGNYFYGARYYDPKWSIFISVDPLAEKYYDISPYAYVANNPINAIDPDGREIRFVIFGKNKSEANRYLIWKNGDAYWTDTGKKYDGTGANKTIDAVITSYKKIEKSGDKNLINRLRTLEKSDLIHFMGENIAGKGSKVRASGEGSLNSDGKRQGTITYFDFSEKWKKHFEESTGTPHSNFATVVHEMEHQFDYDIGNSADFTYPSSSESPQEIRAVFMENIARKLENKDAKLRTVYGKSIIDAKLLQNPPNLKCFTYE